MYHQNDMEFSEWIVVELDERGWSRSEAARRGGISPSMFDKVINGHAKPGIKFIEGLAKAFKISEAEVLMHMSQQERVDPWVVEMLAEAEKLNDDDRREVLAYIRMKNNLRKKK